MEVIEVEDPLDQEAMLVVDVAVDVAAEVVHLRQARSILTLLPVTGAGCVAIWPVTVLKPVRCSLREVAILALPVENSLYPGKKAHSVDAAVDGKPGLVPSMCCTMGTGMNIPWMMQDNCTSH